MDSFSHGVVCSTSEKISVFIGRTNVETETPILWPPDVKS